MSCREGLEFGTEVRSDCAALNGVVADMIATGVDIHVLRDYAGRSRRDPQRDRSGVEHRGCAGGARSADSR